jgi:hypothetical protein
MTPAILTLAAAPEYAKAGSRHTNFKEGNGKERKIVIAEDKKEVEEDKERKIVLKQGKKYKED